MRTLMKLMTVAMKSTYLQDISTKDTKQTTNALQGPNSKAAERAIIE
jgi:hypothetical protein